MTSHFWIRIDSAPVARGSGFQVPGRQDVTHYSFRGFIGGRIRNPAPDAREPLNMASGFPTRQHRNAAPERRSWETLSRIRSGDSELRVPSPRRITAPTRTQGRAQPAT